MNLVSYEISIAASASVVYRLLTTVDGLKLWIAADAVVERKAGGKLQWTHENGATMIGRFLELAPPRRIVFTYGWEGDLMGLPPESSTVEIDLEERAGGTILRLSHRGIPPDVVEDHRRGWIFFLGRLRDALAGDAGAEATTMEVRTANGLTPHPRHAVAGPADIRPDGSRRAAGALTLLLAASLPLAQRTSGSRLRVPAGPAISQHPARGAGRSLARRLLRHAHRPPSGSSGGCPPRACVASQYTMCYSFCLAGRRCEGSRADRRTRLG